MQLGTTFSARTVQPAYADGGGANWPAGAKVPCVIVDSEVKPTQDGASGMLVLTCEAIDGEHKGSSMKYRLNIFNQNPQARDIAQRQLSSLCHVVGVYDVTDSAQLHGKPFVAVVKANPSAQYPNGTQISGVLDMQGNDPGKAGSGAPAAQPTQQSPAFAQPAAQAPAPAAGPSWAGGAAPAQAPAPAPAPAPAWGPSAAPAGPMNGAPAWAQPR